MDFKINSSIDTIFDRAITALQNAENCVNKQLKNYTSCSYKGVSKQYNAYDDLYSLKKKIGYYKNDICILKILYNDIKRCIAEKDNSAKNKLYGPWFKNIDREISHAQKYVGGKINSAANFYQKFYNENQWYRISWDMTSNMAKILGDIMSGNVYDLVNDGIAFGADIWAMSACVSNNYMHSKGYYDDDIFHSIQRENDKVYKIDDAADLAKTAGADGLSSVLKACDYAKDIKDIFDNGEDVAKLFVGDYKEGKYVKYANSEAVTKGLKLKTSEKIQKNITEKIAKKRLQGQILENLTKGDDISRVSKKMAAYQNFIKYGKTVGSVAKGKNLGQTMFETTLIGGEFKDTKEFIDDLRSDISFEKMSDDNVHSRKYSTFSVDNFARNDSVGDRDIFGGYE
ncbi:MAG: hypothetical protein NC393_08505 [Clostridium sp.]|nr:hypothetical protein [Clostridium sp.]MCM1207711.1 hypothetical protein [Ruminococcus sp.]